MSDRTVGRCTSSVWQIEVVEQEANVTRFMVSVDGRSATRSEFFSGLIASGSCRDVLTRCLLELPADQIYWETPPLSFSTAATRSEFVAVSAGLSGEPDGAPFQQFFQPDQLVATFSNLGGDAVLVAPTDHHRETRCNYLMSFLRSGADAQVHAVWAAVGQAALSQLGDRPVWVSTAGGGVPWLHFRVDSTPKYYSHAPYRQSV
ncbi:MAG: hypothetical protein GY925_29970 [Actinomycetia bacterium]|nr:hypothetical protein [Actinomycetes bacterium]